MKTQLLVNLSWVWSSPPVVRYWAFPSPPTWRHHGYHHYHGSNRGLQHIQRVQKSSPTSEKAVEPREEKNKNSTRVVQVEERINAMDMDHGKAVEPLSWGMVSESSHPSCSIPTRPDQTRPHQTSLPPPFRSRLACSILPPVRRGPSHPFC
jgi:hypothetical protein